MQGVMETDTEVTCRVRLAIQKVRTSRTRAARHALALNSGWLRDVVLTTHNNSSFGNTDDIPSRLSIFEVCGPA